MYCFYFQSTRTLELGLALEAKVIKLKQQSIKMFQVALLGCACGRLIELLQNAFGYPESLESKLLGKAYENIERKFEEDEGDKASKASSKGSKRSVKVDAEGFVVTPAASGKSPPAKRRRFRGSAETLPDLCKLADALPIVPVTSTPVSETGVDPRSYKRVSGEGQSVYYCRMTIPGSSEICEHSIAQKAQICTHIRRKHLGSCIKCRLCPYRSFRYADFASHLKNGPHKNEPNEWLEPTPPLEGQNLEEVDAALARNLADIDADVEEMPVSAVVKAETSTSVESAAPEAESSVSASGERIVSIPLDPPVPADEDDDEELPPVNF